LQPFAKEPTSVKANHGKVKNSDVQSGTIKPPQQNTAESWFQQQITPLPSVHEEGTHLDMNNVSTVLGRQPKNVAMHFAPKRIQQKGANVV
jgi:hypothetical protein